MARRSRKGKTTGEWDQVEMAEKIWSVYTKDVLLTQVVVGGTKERYIAGFLTEVAGLRVLMFLILKENGKVHEELVVINPEKTIQAGRLMFSGRSVTGYVTAFDFGLRGKPRTPSAVESYMREQLQKALMDRGGLEKRIHRFVRQYAPKNFHPSMNLCELSGDWNASQEERRRISPWGGAP